MNQLFNFFTKGLMIMFLITLGLFLLSKIKKIITSVFAYWILCWVILAILGFLALPLIAVIWFMKN